MHLGIIKITYNWTATHFMEDSFVNLGDEVIPTLLWKSGTSESATACFVISLSICYWLFKCRVLRVVCVCLCVCMWERERERERGSQYSVVCVCVCARMCERGRHGHITTAACVQTRDASIRYSVSVSAPILAFSADLESVRWDRSKSDIVRILLCYY